MKNLVIVTVAALSILSGAAFAQDKYLADRHAERGVACASCHQETPPSKAVPADKCLSCHGDYAKLKELTKDAKPNPHYTHMLDQPCAECHKAHKPSVNMCQECHQFDFKVP